MKIKKLRTSLLMPAELVKTINNYLAALEAGGPEAIDPFIQVIIDLLKEDTRQLKEALAAISINSLVNEVAELDAIRDDTFIGFRDMVDAYKRRRDETILAAYDKVWPVIEIAGTNLYSLGYTAQSGQLEVLFNELNKPEYTEAINTLGVTSLFEELKQNEINFSIKFKARLEEDTAKTYPTLGEAKKKAVPHVNILIEAIRILEEASPGSQEAVITAMNAATNEVMAVARARKTRSESPEDQPEEAM